MAIPEIDSVLLSAADLKDLERSYQNVHGDDMQEVSMPEMTSKPEFQRSLGPSKLVEHGKATKRFVSMIGAMRNVSEFTVEEWEQIHEDQGPIYLYPAPAGLSPAPSLVSSASSSFPLLERRSGSKGIRSRKQPSKARKTQQRPVLSFSDARSDTADSSQDDDEEDDLEGFVVQDVEPIYRRHTASTLSSSPPPDFPPPKTKPFFEPTQFTATQDTNDDDDVMPDLSDLLGSKKAQPLSSPPMQKRVHESLESGKGQRGRRRRILEEEDSDE
jgi:ATP-dependent DNA helicase MPH1